MFRLTVHDYFSSAHQLKGYRGKCEAVHGHNWRVEVKVQGEVLNEIGLLMDFTDLKKLLKGVIDPLDHVMLNDIGGLRGENPSSEIIARYIYNQMKAALPAGITMHSVTVWESENARALYCE
ncbi:MAG TPA: 6-carboxytetrahydropterin synthase QueD [Spirochaetota bacterium]|nr:6-carboxytetrahydropterin synthase QueD [Spirochaetota bacterium]HPL17344.1 6-carboxytetrahydropterin synthase QueD [Spirochaetota bacterium]HQF09638.1 6-carboxytetrahydropterin synthase QueD [Spirochaetota bacterium]HQH98292.1 6-carboxytetrahydropterin synthase QueD [Spirochaetota bacterium]HQJ71720.1 6-carboxytetrahydropterin synthase QueD [Spirochaetota bacterium]